MVSLDLHLQLHLLTQWCPEMTIGVMFYLLLVQLQGASS